MARSLVQRINDNLPAFSKSEKTLANYLLTNPDSLMAETTGTLAQQVGVSPMTISRFIRKVGFANYAEARRFVKAQVFGPDHLVGHTIDERYATYAARKRSRSKVVDNLESEANALRQVYDLRSGKTWRRCVMFLATAKHVYIAGFQAIRHLAIGLAAQLEFVRPHVTYLDGLNGTYIQAFANPGKRITVVIVDTHPYARTAPVLAARAADAGRDVIIICDELCHWAREITPNVLSVTLNTGLLFRSTVALSALSGLMANDTIDYLGESVTPRLDAIGAAQKTFGQYQD